jgi:hypothetical protein
VSDKGQDENQTELDTFFETDNDLKDEDLDE